MGVFNFQMMLPKYLTPPRSGQQQPQTHAEDRNPYVANLFWIHQQLNSELRRNSKHNPADRTVTTIAKVLD
jgi:hypothetical protein